MASTKSMAVAISLLVTGCGSLPLKPSPPKPISSKAPESAIVLKGPVTVNDKGRSNVFPPGKYRPLYEDKGGYYFQAPDKVLVNDVASYGYDGGLFVARGSTEPAQWYVVRPRGKVMGRFKTIPPYTIVP